MSGASTDTVSMVGTVESLTVSRDTTLSSHVVLGSASSDTAAVTLGDASDNVISANGAVTLAYSLYWKGHVTFIDASTDAITVTDLDCMFNVWSCHFSRALQSSQMMSHWVTSQRTSSQSTETRLQLRI